MSGYRTQSSDTAPEVERILFEHYRRMKPAEKIALLCELSKATQELALAGLRRRHPEADAAELRHRLACLRLGIGAMEAAFGWRSDNGVPE